MATFTAQEKADVAWVTGFRARMEGKSKPSGQDKAKGWDAANVLLVAIESAHSGGGYGP